LVRGEEFATLRRGRYLTQSELAEQLGMSVQNVARLEHAKEVGMRAKNFRRLAEVVGLTPDQLHARIGVHAGEGRAMGKRRYGLAEVAADVEQPASFRRGSIQPAVEIDRFHGVSAARPEERPGVERGTTLVPAGTARCFSVTVDGDCMEPKYRHGDVVIFSVDAAEREGIVEGRNYFIQFDDGENTFKRVFSDPRDEDRLVLRCWNKRYPQRGVDRRRVKLLARAVYRLVPDDGA
jgi:transcriptional regulator with XRE-family HTH domain